MYLGINKSINIPRYQWANQFLNNCFEEVRKSKKKMKMKRDPMLDIIWSRKTELGSRWDGVRMRHT